MSPPIFRISMLLTGTFLVVLKLTYFNKGLLVILGNTATYDSLAGEEGRKLRKLAPFLFAQPLHFLKNIKDCPNRKFYQIA